MLSSDRYGIMKAKLQLWVIEVPETGANVSAAEPRGCGHGVAKVSFVRPTSCCCTKGIVAKIPQILITA